MLKGINSIHICSIVDQRVDHLEVAFATGPITGDAMQKQGKHLRLKNNSNTDVIVAVTLGEFITARENLPAADRLRSSAENCCAAEVF